MKIYELNIDFANPSQKAVQTIDDMPIGFKVTATVKGVHFDGLVWIDFAGYSDSEKISIANGSTFEIESPRNGVFKIANQENVDANYMSVKISTSIVKSDFYFESKGGFDPAVLSDYVTDEELDGKLSAYAKTDDLSAYAKNDDLSAYATTEYVDGKISETNAKIDEATVEAKKAAKNAGGSNSNYLLALSSNAEHSFDELMVCAPTTNHGGKHYTPGNAFYYENAITGNMNNIDWQLPAVKPDLAVVHYDENDLSTLFQCENAFGTRLIKSIPQNCLFTNNKNWLTSIIDFTQEYPVTHMFNKDICEQKAFDCILAENPANSPVIYATAAGTKAIAADNWIVALPFFSPNGDTPIVKYLKFKDVNGLMDVAGWVRLEDEQYYTYETYMFKICVKDLEFENVNVVYSPFDITQTESVTVKGDFKYIDASVFNTTYLRVEGRSIVDAQFTDIGSSTRNKGLSVAEFPDITFDEFADFMFKAIKDIYGKPDRTDSQWYANAYNYTFLQDGSVSTPEYVEIKLKDVTLHGNPTTTGFWNQQWPTATFEDANGNMKSFHVNTATSWTTINNDPFIPTAVKASFRQNLDSTGEIPFQSQALSKATKLKEVSFENFSLSGRLPTKVFFLGQPTAKTINKLVIGKNSVFTIAGNALQTQLIGSNKQLDVLVLDNINLATKILWLYNNNLVEFCHKVEIGNSIDANGNQTSIADIKSAFMDSNVSMNNGTQFYPRIGWQPAEKGDCEVWFNGLHIFTFGDGYSETVDNVTTFKWVCKWEKFPVA